MIESPIFSIDCVVNKEAEIVGNLPVLISVPHDGRRTTIGHQYICPLPGGIPADKNVRFLARDICFRVKDSTTATPSLVIDEIQRSRRWATSSLFNDYVHHRVAQISEEFENASPKPPLFLDLHGFVNQPPFGDYDLIIGTAHRRSLQSDVDVWFGQFMSGRGYNIYLPNEVPVNGELFAADSARTLTRKVSTEFPHVDCMQIEIFRDYRTIEGRERGIQLAYDMGDFIIEYVSNY